MTNVLVPLHQTSRLSYTLLMINRAALPTQKSRMTDIDDLFRVFFNADLL